MSFAMTGLASGWPGGVMLRSDDSGNSWPAVGATNSRAKVFTTAAAIGSHHGYSIDHGAVLTVTPRYSAHTLSSVTEYQLYGHANLAAYGADGRWEIVAFRTVTDNTGSYTINDFLRGLYGTEWATGLHEAGDLLIMLDTSTIGFFGLPTNALGSQRLYRAVTQGASLDSASDVTDTYEARNLMPLSPVDFKGWRNPSDWSYNVSWSPRTRWPVEVFSGVAVPLGESSESYALEIYNSDYSTLKRTIMTTSPSATWTEAQQIEDFGSKQQTMYYKLRQVSSVVGYGHELTGSKTLVVSEDPYIDYVVLLMQCDDAAMIDQRGHTVTLNGNAALSGTNGGSCSFDGAGDYLQVAASADFNVGSAWTIEFFYQPATASHTGKVISTRTASSSGYEIGIYNSGAGNKLLVEGWGGNSTGGAQFGSTTLASGVEKHIAITHDGTNVRGYIGGVHELVFGSTASWSAAGKVLRIGLPVPYNEPCNGYIRKIRFTKGVARYTGTGSFTPPASFPNP